MALQQKPYAGVFEGMDFGTYSYEHYPLAMNGPSGEQRVVANEDEQKAAEDEGFKEPERIGAPKNLTGKEHDALTDRIAELEAELAAAKATVQAPVVKPAAPVAVAPAKV